MCGGVRTHRAREVGKGGARHAGERRLAIGAQRDAGRDVVAREVGARRVGRAAEVGEDLHRDVGHVDDRVERVDAVANGLAGLALDGGAGSEVGAGGAAREHQEFAIGGVAREGGAKERVAQGTADVDDFAAVVAVKESDERVRHATGQAGSAGGARVVAARAVEAAERAGHVADEQGARHAGLERRQLEGLHDGGAARGEEVVGGRGRARLARQAPAQRFAFVLAEEPGLAGPVVDLVEGRATIGLHADERAPREVRRGQPALARARELLDREGVGVVRPEVRHEGRLVAGVAPVGRARAAEHGDGLVVDDLHGADLVVVVAAEVARHPGLPGRAVQHDHEAIAPPLERRRRAERGGRDEGVQGREVGRVGVPGDDDAVVQERDGDGVVVTAAAGGVGLPLHARGAVVVGRAVLAAGRCQEVVPGAPEPGEPAQAEVLVEREHEGVAGEDAGHVRVLEGPADDVGRAARLDGDVVAGVLVQGRAKEAARRDGGIDVERAARVVSAEIERDRAVFGDSPGDRHQIAPARRLLPGDRRRLGDRAGGVRDDQAPFVIDVHRGALDAQADRAGVGSGRHQEVALEALGGGREPHVDARPGIAPHQARVAVVERPARGVGADVAPDRHGVLGVERDVAGGALEGQRDDAPLGVTPGGPRGRELEGAGEVTGAIAAVVVHLERERHGVRRLRSERGDNRGREQNEQRDSWAQGVLQFSRQTARAEGPILRPPPGA